MAGEIMIMDSARINTRCKPHRKQCIPSCSHVTLPWQEQKGGWKKGGYDLDNNKVRDHS